MSAAENVPSATTFCFVISTTSRECRAAKRRRVKPMLYAVDPVLGKSQRSFLRLQPTYLCSAFTGTGEIY
jgi:hypothetical protein